MEIISTAVVSIHMGIGQMMKPITHAEALIDLRPECNIPHHLESATHLLVGEVMDGEKCDSCPNL